MKVIILAGGWGTRLGQMSELIPKPMVTIGNKPVLWHIMKLYSHYGYNDFIIALGVKGDVIMEYFYNFEALNNDFTINLETNQLQYHNKHHGNKWKVTLVDTGLNTLKGGRIKRVEKYLDDNVIISSSRHSLGGEYIGGEKIKKYLSKLAGYLLFKFGINTKDPTNNYKLYSGKWKIENKSLFMKRDDIKHKWI